MTRAAQSIPDRDIERPRLRAIADRDLPMLQRIFEKAHSTDPYARSAAYFAMTGRGGLWVYGGRGKGLVVAAHPNDPSAILAFPPFGDGGAQLLPSLLNEPWLDGKRLLLSRFTAAALSETAKVLPQAADWIVEETRLDWRYPVHVLDTTRVALHEGQAFHDFRKNVHRAWRAGLTTHPLDPEQDRQSVTAIASAWALDHEGSRAELTAPVRRILDLMACTTLPIHGLMVVDENGRPVGYSIWEETSPQSGMANGLGNSALPGMKGPSELSYLAACDTLRARGFNAFCIGGSETPGLDAFKRKMNPAASVDLVTLDPGRNKPRAYMLSGTMRKPLEPAAVR